MDDCYYKTLTCDSIRELKDELDWDLVTQYSKLSEEFISQLSCPLRSLMNGIISE